MKHFLSVYDVQDMDLLIEKALGFKEEPLAAAELGKGKTLGLLFFNPSLRTRISTQKAAMQLGMNVIVMNVGQDAWALEMGDGTVMDGNTSEHIKEAFGVLGEYCDIIGVRSFPRLKNREEDYAEAIIESVRKYSHRPVVSLESATRHPLQSLADVVTIRELLPLRRPRVVLTWAPHPRALPQAVANSFAEWVSNTDADLVIAHPEGYELDEEFTRNAYITHNKAEAFEGADIIYAKNWSSYSDYGSIISQAPDWTVTMRDMRITNNARFMHCLPVRRNVVVEDAVLDSSHSVVLHQAGNRVWAAQAVLAEIVQDLLKNHGH